MSNEDVVVVDKFFEVPVLIATGFLIAGVFASNGQSISVVGVPGAASSGNSPQPQAWSAGTIGGVVMMAIAVLLYAMSVASYAIARNVNNDSELMLSASYLNINVYAYILFAMLAFANNSYVPETHVYYWNANTYMNSAAVFNNATVNNTLPNVSWTMAWQNTTRYGLVFASIFVWCAAWVVLAFAVTGIRNQSARFRTDINVAVHSAVCITAFFLYSSPVYYYYNSTALFPALITIVQLGLSFMVVATFGSASYLFIRGMLWLYRHGR